MMDGTEDCFFFLLPFIFSKTKVINIHFSNRKYFGQPLSTTTTELDEEPWLLKKLIDSLMSEYIDGKISDYALYEIYQPDAAKEKIASLVEKIEGEGDISFSFDFEQTNFHLVQDVRYPFPESTQRLFSLSYVSTWHHFPSHWSL